MRSISGFNGSSTGGSFSTGEPVYASALNKLSTGIDQARTMMSNDIQFNTATGGAVYALPQDVTDGIGNNYVLPWTVQVYQEVQEDDTIKYFLRTARGICNYTWSEFPFGPASTTSPSGYSLLEYTGNRTFSNECIIKDYSIYPNGSYKIGTDTTGNSPWMADDAAIQIKNAEDGGSDTWYVTVSKIDWFNKMYWDDANRIQDKERPFLSVFAAGSAAATAVFKETQNTRATRVIPLPQVATPVYPPSTRDAQEWDGYVLPRHIGYDYKKVAWIGWNATDKKWDVVQYILHQVELDIPYQQVQRWMGPLLPSDYPPENVYAIAKDAHFDPYIENLTLLSGFSSGALTDYTINSDNWWYDVVAYTIPR